jgi:biopolymer transport protein TolQ
VCPFRQQESYCRILIGLNLPIACATVALPGKNKLFRRETISGLAFLLFDNRLSILIGQAGWVARTVLVILLIFSVFSWAIIFQKSSQLGGIDRKTSTFLQMYRSGRGLPDPNTLRAGAGSTPLVPVYAAGYRELEAQLSGANPSASAGSGRLKNPAAVGVEMQVAAGDQMRKLERGMPWLATTASVSPFIGLLGTVWGVMDSFSGLGDAGTASLRAVAPGISEALITTAAGLVAAIPALIAYNHYLHGIRSIASRMDGFTAEFVAKIETLYKA